MSKLIPNDKFCHFAILVFIFELEMRNFEILL